MQETGLALAREAACRELLQQVLIHLEYHASHWVALLSKKLGR